MRRMIKKTTLFILTAILLISINGCNKDQDIAEEPPIVEVVIPEEEGIPEGMAVNPLTGLYIDEAAAKRRPVAVMINNLRAALPQSGISQADIIYETLAEGDITRLLAVFQDFDAEKIGPVRSARHYYLDFAFNHDAIFVHYGGSNQAYAEIANLKVDNLNGLSYLDTIMFWRDAERRKKKGMYEHSVYTSAEKIMLGWEREKYRTEITENLQPMLNFYDEDTTPQGVEANKVDLPFTNRITTSFEYNEESGLYNRFQYGGPHIDENNQNQLTTKNIIVQYTEIKHIPGDTEGRRDMKLISQGNGVYITNGKAVPITWRKDSHRSPTEYRDENGQRLLVNKGNTWVIIFPNNREIQLKAGGENEI